MASIVTGKARNDQLNNGLAEAAHQFFLFQDLLIREIIEESMQQIHSHYRPEMVTSI